MKKDIVLILLIILFCREMKAQSIETVSLPIYMVSSTELMEVLDSIIAMNCFQRDSGMSGVYTLNVLDSAATVFTVSECYVSQNSDSQDTMLKIPGTLGVYYIIQYKSSIIMVWGRSILKKGVSYSGKGREVAIIYYPDNDYNYNTDDDIFPCTIIVHNNGEKYHLHRF